LIKRTGARILLIDSDERVLLIHERTGDDAQYTHWLTPGGGVEDGEDLPTAAVREVYEETGLRVELALDAPQVYVRDRIWSWRELTFDQTDHYFAVRIVAGLPVEPAGLTEVEASLLLGYRWWSVEELRASTETIEPPVIADLVQHVLAGAHGGSVTGP
jgi:8-oxo-dGTP pyrophosphatase MutT (NUDIX family)